MITILALCAPTLPILAHLITRRPVTDVDRRLAAVDAELDAELDRSLAGAR